MKFRSLSETRPIMKTDTELSLPLLITRQSQIPLPSLTILLLKKSELASYSRNGLYAHNVELIKGCADVALKHHALQVPFISVSSL